MPFDLLFVPLISGMAWVFEVENGTQTEILEENR